MVVVIRYDLVFYAVFDWVHPDEEECWWFGDGVS